MHLVLALGGMGTARVWVSWRVTRGVSHVRFSLTRALLVCQLTLTSSLFCGRQEGMLPYCKLPCVP